MNMRVKIEKHKILNEKIAVIFLIEYFYTEHAQKSYNSMMKR